MHTKSQAAKFHGFGVMEVMDRHTLALMNIKNFILGSIRVQITRETKIESRAEDEITTRLNQLF